MDAPPSYSSVVNPPTEDNRSLPDGWIRRLDPRSGRFYYVDMNCHPPRSIPVHPLDDDEYLSTLPPMERKEPSRSDRQSEKQQEINHSYDVDREVTAGPSRRDNTPPRSGGTPPSRSSNSVANFGRRYGANLVENRFGNGLTASERERAMYERQIPYEYGNRGYDPYAQDAYGHDARAGVLMVPVDRYSTRGYGFRGRRRRGGLLTTLVQTAMENGRR